MSVIQYWNSETTALISSEKKKKEKKRDRERNISVKADTPADSTTAVSLFKNETYFQLYFWNNTSEPRTVGVQIYFLHLCVSPFQDGILLLFKSSFL